MPSTSEHSILPESLSNETIAAIAAAVAKAMLPIQPQISRREKTSNNWLGLASLILATVIFITGGIGVWITAQNKQTALDMRLLNVETTQLKNTRRVDDLEIARTSTAGSTTELTDLKESFDQFRIQYREDMRDLKQQIEQAKQGKK